MTCPRCPRCGRHVPNVEHMCVPKKPENVSITFRTKLDEWYVSHCTGVSGFEDDPGFMAGARAALEIAAEMMRPSASEGHNAGSQRLKCVDELRAHARELE